MIVKRRQGPLHDRPGAYHPAVRDLLKEGVRARAAAITGRVQAGAPVIVKTVGGRVRGAAVGLVGRYVGKLSDHAEDIGQHHDGDESPFVQQTSRQDGGTDQKSVLHDEWGDRVPFEAILDHMAAGSRLPDARHLVFSAPGAGVADHRAALTATLRETAAAWGVPAVWAIHDDTGNVHAHVLLGSRLPTGAMLPFAPDARLLDGIRAVFARHLRGCGVNVSAERATDRPGWAPAAEQVLVRPQSGGRAGARMAARVADRTVARLREGAPLWWACYGEGALASLALAPPAPMVPKRQRLAQARMLEADLGPPGMSWRMLRKEDASLAVWMADRFPGMFMAASAMKTGLAHKGDNAADLVELRLARRRRAALLRAAKQREDLIKAVEAWGISLPGMTPEQLVRKLRQAPIPGTIGHVAPKPVRSTTLDR